MGEKIMGLGVRTGGVRGYARVSFSDLISRLHCAGEHAGREKLALPDPIERSVCRGKSFPYFILSKSPILTRRVGDIRMICKTLISFVHEF